MRLDKYISDNSDLTRTLASKAIRSGRIRVNQTKAKSGSLKIDPKLDVIRLDGVALQAQSEYRYFMMNKPKGVVCANSDAEHPLVFDLMKQEINLHQLHTVGRLDKDTTGLLLVTDDGQWSHKISSPKHHQTKTYRAQLAEPLVADAESRIEQGIVLNDDVKPTLPAKLVRISDTEVLLTISEGRYHQVKRMMGALGNRVVELHRQSIGSIQLDETLASGEYRLLTEQEITQL